MFLLLTGGVHSNFDISFTYSCHNPLNSPHSIFIYIVYIKEILKPQNLISNIKEDALKKDNISDLILSLYRIATIAHIERDEKTVEKSIDTFKNNIRKKQVI